MIRRIEARNYRCLRKVDVELDRFQLAVGPNASGKSTLFDAPLFLRDLPRDTAPASPLDETPCQIASTQGLGHTLSTRGHQQ